MSLRDRRLGFRVDLEIFLNQYIGDRPFRGLTTNVSETGLYVNRTHLPTGSRPVAKQREIGIEFALPGTGEVIWARGEVCYDVTDPYFHGTGIRFTGIPKCHARLVRDYCVEARRTQLSQLLARIQRPLSPAAHAAA